MIEPPLRLDVFEIRGRLKGGQSLPVLAEAQDEEGNQRTVVLKLRRPESPWGHFEGTSLACELIVAMLARHLDLPVPDYAIVRLPDFILPGVPDKDLREVLRRNVGENFGSEYHEGMALWQPDLRPEASDVLSSLEGVLVLDATVINGDRSIEKPNLLMRGSDVLMIDHSLALPVHLWDAETLAASPIFPDQQIERHCAKSALQYRGLRYEELLSRWRDGVSPNDLTRVRDVIPSTWEKQAGDLDKIFTFLAGRPEAFGGIPDSLRRVLR